MKFSERWLRSFVDPKLSSEALADLLTMAGHEVEARDPAAPEFSGVIVGLITSVAPHPNASRLNVCEVDIGTETLSIVCGAPNARAGMKVPCAVVGAALPGMSIGQAMMRGVESQGMLCSARELGISDDQDGLLALDAAATVGAPLRAWLDLDDKLFTLKLTPNRGDCLSLRGLAREIGALTSAPVSLPDIARVTPLISDRRDIVLDADAACPRYCGRVICGIDTQARTPDWMVRRLVRSGLRPISPVVDVTNYVMLELGQPLHAFDHDTLSGNIHVRFAEPGEQFELLNGSQIKLIDTHLVIADEARPVALAGVMGGQASSVGTQTKNVFLESAYFAPEVIAKTARGLEIASDAAHRYERGVDFELAGVAIERATQLLIDICGGRAGEVSESVGTLPARPAVTFRPARAGRVLGVDVAREEIWGMFERLGCRVEEAVDHWHVTPPSYRFDMSIEEDLIEEVARIHGYDDIAATLPRASIPMRAMTESAFSVYELKRLLAAREYFEVVSMSFVDRGLEADFAGEREYVVLANPIASQMSVMRSTLIGSLVENLQFNVARKQDRVRLFEVAACYCKGPTGFVQEERVAGIALGSAYTEQWGLKSRAVDYFDVRADVEAILGTVRATFSPSDHPAFHPGRSATVRVGDGVIGWIGALHPRLVQKYELPSAAVAFELRTAPILKRAVSTYESVSRFPPVRRDLSLVAPDSESAESLRDAIAGAGGPLVTDVVLFDVYRGIGLPDGKKSLAFRVLLQDTEKTLTDVDVEALIREICRVLEQNHNAVLRV